MADRIVLCRRDVADIGAPAQFCAKPITTPNNLKWCDGCRAHLPWWPTTETVAADQEVK